MNKLALSLTCLTTGVLLSGCRTIQKFEELQDPPRMSQIHNPLANPHYNPVTMPMPAPQELPQHYRNSLWRAGARGFFKDQRAHQVGDLLVVDINIGDNATLKNESKSSRNNSTNVGVNTFLGYEQYASKVLPEAVDPTSLFNFSNNPNHTGTGEIKRTENIKLKVAAVVNQMLPNGNLVISGRQEVRINSELRELLLTGIIRPQDVTSDNRINYDKIAEARISYGGHGDITNMQELPFGHRFVNAVSPF